MPKLRSVSPASRRTVFDPTEVSRKNLGVFLRSGEFRRTILGIVEPAIRADERAVASSCVDHNDQRAL